MSEANDDSVSDPQVFTLNQFPEKLAVVGLPAGAEIPSWAESSSLFSVTATATETSIICATRSVPAKVVCQKPFTAFAVQGPLDFGTVGVLATLLVPMAEAGISVFVISTYDTDWILIPLGSAERAAQEWRRRGHTVSAAVPVKKSRTPEKGSPRKGKP